MMKIGSKATIKARANHTKLEELKLQKGKTKTGSLTYLQTVHNLYKTDILYHLLCK